MTRNKISVTLPNNFVGKKFKDFRNNFLKYGSKCLNPEINKMAKTEPYYIDTWNYLEDGLREIRKVNCINFGIPVQLSINFYT